MRIIVALFSAVLLLGACSDSGGDGGIESSDEAAELLEEEGYLSDGVVSFGPVGPSDDDVDVALCDYLFGTTDSVSDRLGVDVELEEGSGYQQLGGNGSGIQCFYNTGDEDPVFGLGLWGRDPIGDDAPVVNKVLIDAPSGDVGFAVYHEDFDGDLLDEADLEEWLEDAGTRYGGQSV